MKNTSHIKTSGFTLIEVLIAMCIFAFVLLGVLSMFGAHIQSNHFSKNYTKAVHLAEDGMEILKRVDYSSELQTYNGSVNNFGQIPNYPVFRRVYTVVPFSDYSVIQVSVVWKSTGRNSQPVVMKSIRSAI